MSETEFLEEIKDLYSSSPALPKITEYLLSLYATEPTSLDTILMDDDVKTKIIELDTPPSLSSLPPTTFSTNSSSSSTTSRAKYHLSKVSPAWDFNPSAIMDWIPTPESYAKFVGLDETKRQIVGNSIYAFLVERSIPTYKKPLRITPKELSLLPGIKRYLPHSCLNTDGNVASGLMVFAENPKEDPLQQSRTLFPLGMEERMWTSLVLNGEKGFESYTRKESLMPMAILFYLTMLHPREGFNLANSTSNTKSSIKAASFFRNLEWNMRELVTTCISCKMLQSQVYIPLSQMLTKNVEIKFADFGFIKIDPDYCCKTWNGEKTAQGFAKYVQSPDNVTKGKNYGLMLMPIMGGFDSNQNYGFQSHRKIFQDQLL